MRKLLLRLFPELAKLQELEEQLARNAYLLLRANEKADDLLAQIRGLNSEVKELEKALDEETQRTNQLYTMFGALDSLDHFGSRKVSA